MSTKIGQRVLVVDDEADILQILEYNLVKEGYEVMTAQDGRNAVEIAKTFKPALVLLDIMMPMQDGVETCRQMREIPALATSFIMFLTARSEEYSEVAAFEAGANDFIAKPIKPRALMSRIASIFKRGSDGKPETSFLKYGDLEIDKASYGIKIKGKSLILPKKEFELLAFLASNPTKVYSRDDLLFNIWGADVYVLARTVDVHVRKVREKIGDEFIVTVKGVGYKFEPNPESLTEAE